MKLKKKVFLLIIVLILHCNDVKISVVKVSELFLLIYGLKCLPRFHKVSRVFLSLFTLFLIITIIHNLFLSFDETVVTNILQRPYICSLGRYIELFCCVSFIELIISYAKWCGLKVAIQNVMKANFYFCSLIIILFVIDFFNIYSGFDVIVDGRLSGFSNEGGPFGLFISMMIVLSIIYHRPFFELVILGSCLLLSISKAGIFLLLLCLLYYLFEKCRKSRKWKIVVLSISIPIVVALAYVGVILFSQYSKSWIDPDYAYVYASQNPDDYNFNAGRVSGLYIGYEMIIKNPIIGIGLGNYPILRNLKEYRGFFPQIPIYDATGLGGIFDLLIQQGFIGLLLFIFVLYKEKKRNSDSLLLLLFICVFLCGVQLTFVYPWILIAFNEIRRHNTKVILNQMVNNENSSRL